ncbi:MAG: hypothetical protein HW421_845 [Ignavibacteria bacterium]|nr:hypothetical protein [Ignavibacteria bacterium]
MKRIVISLILILAVKILFQQDLAAQSISIKRTDVDSARSGFITATYIFGVDVKIDNIKGCYSAIFQMQYDNMSTIILSDVQKPADSFPKSALNWHEVKDTTPEVNNLNIVVNLLPADVKTGFNNPMIAHVEFVVTPKAKSKGNFNLSFKEISAHLVDSTGAQKSVTLADKAYSFTIHGFEMVLPGDADNNRIVDSKDWGEIVKFFTNDAQAKKTMRQFKRVNASTHWSKQLVLTWDNAAAMRSDCDGNGIVTQNDILVVDYNFGKTDTATSSIVPSTDNGKLWNKIERNAKSNILPVSVNSNEPCLGIAGNISIDGLPSDVKISGVEPGNFFDPEHTMLYYNLEEKNQVISFAIGTSTPQNPSFGTGTLLKIIYESENNTSQVPTLRADDATCIGTDGNFYPVSNVISDVAYSENEQPISDFIFKTSEDYLSVEPEKNGMQLQSLKIYDLQGALAAAYSPSYNTSTQSFSIKNLSAGGYFAVAGSSNGASQVYCFVKYK